MKIRMIGCGAMGAGMVKNLVKNGYDVTTYDPDSTKQEQMMELGATPVSSSAYGLSSIDIVLLSLPTSTLVKDTLIGSNGILHHLKNDSFILDMSTTDVGVTKQLAETAAAKSIHYLDCPVSNGPVGANDGTLTIMVGGEEDAFLFVLPVLESIGKEIRYIGPSRFRPGRKALQQYDGCRNYCAAKRDICNRRKEWRGSEENCRAHVDRICPK